MSSFTYPLNQLLTWATWEVESFRLQRRQEHSRTAGGEVISRDLGPPLWTATYRTVQMTNSAMVSLEGRIGRLRGGIGTFRAWDLRRAAPLAFPSGTGFGSPTILDVSADGTEIRLQGLTASASLTFGDYISWNDDAGRRLLHRISEDVTANLSGVTGWIDIEPAVTYATGVGTAVTLAEANCLMRMDVDGMDVQRAGAFTSQMTISATQVIPR